MKFLLRGFITLGYGVLMGLIAWLVFDQFGVLLFYTFHWGSGLLILAWTVLVTWTIDRFDVGFGSVPHGLPVFPVFAAIHFTDYPIAIIVLCVPVFFWVLWLVVRDYRSRYVRRG